MGTEAEFPGLLPYSYPAGLSGFRRSARVLNAEALWADAHDRDGEDDEKDDSYLRDETPETARALADLYARLSSDDARLDEGGFLFENLYAMFGGRIT